MGENREAERLRSLLARLEWAGHEWDGEGIMSACPNPDCQRLQEDSYGHEPDCWLAAALRPTEG